MHLSAAPQPPSSMCCLACPSMYCSTASSMSCPTRTTIWQASLQPLIPNAQLSEGLHPRCPSSHCSGNGFVVVLSMMPSPQYQQPGSCLSISPLPSSSMPE